VQWETTLQPYYPVLDHSPSDYQNTVQHQPPNRAYQCPAYLNIVSSPYYNLGPEWWNNWSYSYNIWGSTHGSAEVPNLDFCLGLGVDSVWLYEFFAGNVGPGPGNKNNVSTNLPARRETQVVAPSQLFALMDSRGGDGGGPGAWTGWDWNEGTPAYPFDPTKGGYLALAPQSQHGKVSNVGFGDYHVEQVPLSYLYDVTNSAPHWNVDNKPHPESWMTYD
jgi:hypothetical protein